MFLVPSFGENKKVEWTQALMFNVFFNVFPIFYLFRDNGSKLIFLNVLKLQVKFGYGS